jgi:hypothetical protein
MPRQTLADSLQKRLRTRKTCPHARFAPEQTIRLDSLLGSIGWTKGRRLTRFSQRPLAAGAVLKQEG